MSDDARQPEVERLRAETARLAAEAQALRAALDESTALRRPAWRWTTARPPSIRPARPWTRARPP